MRIVIFGRPGSGKSTFAVNLGAKTGTPVYHLDKYFFDDHWRERNTEDFMRDQHEIVSKESWIIDGNSLRSLDIRYAKADAVIYFYLPFYLCLFRTFKRFFIKDVRIDDRAENCHEKVSWKLVKYMRSFEERAQKELMVLRKKYPKIRFYEVRSDEEAIELMTTLTSRASK